MSPCPYLHIHASYVFGCVWGGSEQRTVLFSFVYLPTLGLCIKWLSRREDRALINTPVSFQALLITTLSPPSHISDQVIAIHLPAVHFSSEPLDWTGESSHIPRHCFTVYCTAVKEQSIQSSLCLVSATWWHAFFGELRMLEVIAIEHCIVNGLF